MEEKLRKRKAEGYQSNRFCKYKKERKVNKMTLNETVN